MRRVASIVLLVLAASLGLWWSGRRAPETPEAAAPTTVDAARPVREVLSPTELEGRNEVADLSPAASEPAAESRALNGRARPLGALHIVVLHDRKPFEGATVELARDAEPVHDLFADSGPRSFELLGRTDAAGSARIVDLAFGRHAVRARAVRDGLELSAETFAGVDSDDSRIELALRSAPRLILRILDVARAPIAGARVEVTGGGNGSNANDPGDLRLELVSDAEGRVEFDAGALSGYVAVATAPDGRMGSHAAWSASGVAADSGRSSVDLVVGAAARLSGRVVGVDAAHLAGAKVLAHRIDQGKQPHFTTHRRTFATAVVDGSYAFPRLPAGAYVLGLEDPGGARLDLPPLEWGDHPLPNSLQPLTVELALGADERVDLPARSGGTLEGFVTDESGVPLSGAKVKVTFAPPTSNFPDGFVLRGAHVWRFDHPTRADDDHPASHWRSVTSADGRYRISGLPPGRVRVEVAAEGRSYDRREAMELAERETKRLEHRLVRAGAIAGVLRRGGYAGVIGASGELAMVAVLPGDGRFRFEGLAPGTYTLAAAHSDAGIAPVPLAEVELRAGETAWIDLDEAARWPLHIRGRVLDQGGPVAGATVRWSRRTIRTDERGRFEFGAAFAPYDLEIDLSASWLGTETGYKFQWPEQGASEISVDLELGTEALRVLAFDAFGAPAAGKLGLRSSAVARHGVDRVQVREAAIDASGSLDVTGLHAGEYEATLELRDGSTAAGAASVPSDEPLVLRAPASGSITVRVRAPDGSPLAGWSVASATWIGEGPAPQDFAVFEELADWRESRTDRDGVAKLRGVRAGAVVVRVTHGFDGSAPREPLRQRLALVHGEHVTLEFVGP